MQNEGNLNSHINRNIQDHTKNTKLKPKDSTRSLKLPQITKFMSSLDSKSKHEES